MCRSKRCTSLAPFVSNRGEIESPGARTRASVSWLRFILRYPPRLRGLRGEPSLLLWHSSSCWFPSFFRHQNLLQPRLPPALLVSLRLSSKPLDLSRNLPDPSANPFASTTEASEFSGFAKVSTVGGYNLTASDKYSAGARYPLLATSMNRLTNIVRRISYQRCKVLSHFHKIRRRFRLQRAFPLHPLRCHPGLVCAFALDLAFVGTLPPPEAKSPALGRRSVAEIERRARFLRRPACAI
jgi:hypothetical protein